MKGKNSTQKIFSLILTFVLTIGVFFTGSMVQIKANTDAPENGTLGSSETVIPDQNTGVILGAALDEASVVKQVKKTEVPGVYDITFGATVKGRKSTTGAVNVIFIMDKSGSMAGAPYTSAKAGANDFAKALLTDQRLAGRVSIRAVEFSHSAYKITDNPITNISQITDANGNITFSNIFGSTGGTTNVGAAFAAAKSYMDPSRDNFVVLLCDGVTNEGGGGGLSPHKYAEQQANDLKNNGATIYSIGYNQTSDTGIKNLKAYASKINDEALYYVGATGNVEKVLGDIKTHILDLVESRKATITDVVPAPFEVIGLDEHVVNENGRTVVKDLPIAMSVDADETATGTVTFQVRINEELVDGPGWYDINDHANNGVYLSYAADDEEKSQLPIAGPNPQAYWQHVRGYSLNRVLCDEEGNPLGSEMQTVAPVSANQMFVTGQSEVYQPEVAFDTAHFADGDAILDRIPNEDGTGYYEFFGEVDPVKITYYTENNVTNAYFKFVRTKQNYRVEHYTYEDDIAKAELRKTEPNVLGPVDIGHMVKIEVLGHDFLMDQTGKLKYVYDSHVKNDKAFDAFAFTVEKDEANNIVKVYYKEIVELPNIDPPKEDPKPTPTPKPTPKAATPVALPSVATYDASHAQAYLCIVLLAGVVMVSIYKQKRNKNH
ncbi:MULTISPECIES: vWA domain-containing protein [unclassified Breznakia]|uniref:vWA domain-containing protein n=1 Tax=unclassified Breznakia TaxID=2623764 RepID=UPI002476DEC0|nr:MULTISPECIES: vWA domain-containing protein [unclassified Breznakia]MDH6368109.1 hypothetical protein [Breznakia sp. PH1-1]MDH6405208.1 hypothetical protein [Breznakia sp. PF1-11]MDH6412912.1 hypothetical protein [Breznakia sp. PFB1-11]MDH6415274.1 hypothetical protein [Breznakia sp. PFB1-14]MDH6417593.1 hypothetical protein [Breznakia sp. PFB1-4]